MHNIHGRFHGPEQLDVIGNSTWRLCATIALGGLLAGNVVRGVTTGDWSLLPPNPFPVMPASIACKARDSSAAPRSLEGSLECNGGFTEALTSPDSTTANLPQGGNCLINFRREGTFPGSKDPGWTIVEVDHDSFTPTSLPVSVNVTAQQFAQQGNFSCLDNRKTGAR